MDKKKRRKYRAEFKREAVALASHPGQTITGVAEDLGVGANLLVGKVWCEPVSGDSLKLRENTEKSSGVWGQSNIPRQKRRSLGP